MKKLLLITESIPFPPRHGREFPTAMFFKYLAANFHVDILVLSNNKQDFEQRVHNLPPNIHSIGFIAIQPNSKFKMILQEFLGIKPSFFSYSFSIKEVKKINFNYDIVWCSPISCYNFIIELKKIGIIVGKNVGIGLNDSITGLYKDSFKELISGRFGINIDQIQNTLRVPFIAHHERKYLSNADFVHVQNINEKNKLTKLLKSNTKLKIIIATNSVKEELYTNIYNVNSKNILLLTSLSGGRADESKWFIQNVWTDFYKYHPEYTLKIVGNPPSKNSWIHQIKGIQIEGFIQNYSDAFKNVIGLVIPIIHSTGIINRALDGLSAGIPIIATPQVINTIDGANDRNSIKAYTKKEFLNALNSLITNKNNTLKIAECGKKLALSKMSWKKSAELITLELNNLIFD